jgi:type III pantothenate kinase
VSPLSAEPLPRAAFAIASTSVGRAAATNPNSIRSGAEAADCSPQVASAKSWSCRWAVGSLDPRPIISSTVPRVVFNLRVLCDRYFNCRPLVVGRADCALPVPPRVDAGTIVGPDRLVNTVGGYDRHGGNLIVVDFGTATTFDVVDTDGAYVGGVIAPGVNLSLEALHMAAAALPHIDVAKPLRAIGTNTVACMQSGVYWGYIGLIEGIVRAVRIERAAPMKVIATGGLASLFAQGTDLFDAIEDDLTMHGLVLINTYNKDTA